MLNKEKINGSQWRSTRLRLILYRWANVAVLILYSEDFKFLIIRIEQNEKLIWKNDFIYLSFYFLFFRAKLVFVVFGFDNDDAMFL